MNSRCILFGYTGYHITEDQRSSFCVDLDADDLSVLDSELFCCLEVQMQMSLGGDDAFTQFNFTGRTDKLAS